MIIIILSYILKECVITIRYSYIHRVYISKNMYIIRDYSGDVNSLPKNSFVISDEQDFLNFIKKTFKDKIIVSNH